MERYGVRWAVVRGMCALGLLVTAACTLTAPAHAATLE